MVLVQPKPFAVGMSSDKFQLALKSRINNMVGAYETKSLEAEPTNLKFCEYSDFNL